jgi:hypothetical protein
MNITTPNTSRFAYMPTPAQELLLKAALFRDERGIAAWNTWKSQIDLVNDKVDGGSFRLFPLLYLNLKALGVADEHTPRLKGIHRKAWYENQMHLHTLSQVLAMFAQAGIPTLALKGAPLALLHYPDVGARPMSDVDVLVPTARANEALDALHAAGWRETHYEQVDKVTPKLMKVRHSWGFGDGKGHGFDLHWHALLVGCFPHADDDFWQSARLLDVNGVDTQTLNPIDMLLHVLAHGGHWNHLPPIRWVADACAVMNTSQDRLDWERLLRLAEKFRITLHLHDMLGYLAGTFDAPVPATTLNALKHAPVTDNERRVYVQFATQTYNFARKAERHWHNYQRYKHMWRVHANSAPPVGLVDFMKVSMSMRSVWDIFPRMIDRARRPNG